MTLSVKAVSVSALEAYKSEIPRDVPEGSVIAKIQKYLSQKSCIWGNPFEKVDYRKFAEHLMPSYHASQSKEIKESFLSVIRNEMKKKFPQAHEVMLTAVDNETLDAFHFSGAEKKAILFLHGNGGFFETCFEQALQLKRITEEDVHVMVLNPRGTGESTGVPVGLNLSLDVIAAFQYLVDVQKIDPSQITIYGHSMGGCIGAQGAQALQEIYSHSLIQMIVDRSFGSLLDFQKDSIKAYEATTQSRISKKMIELWNMDSVDSLLSLKGRVGVVSHSHDEVIDERLSLVSALRDRHAFSSKKFEIVDLEEIDGEVRSKPHSRFFREDEFANIRKLFQFISVSS
jgi:pimeloyl-ACP methyl ester carboxylesterase